MMKPTFIENYQQQMGGSMQSMQMALPSQMMPMQPFAGADNSFE